MIFYLIRGEMRQIKDMRMKIFNLRERSEKTILDFSGGAKWIRRNLSTISNLFSNQQ